MPLLSILVPIYNTDKYLSRCIESIIEQTIKNIEIICINDGSTDGSLKTLEEFASKDPRIRIISKPNTGYGDSMNVGLSYAKGEYIGIVESDDFILPDMFETLFQTAQKSNADIVKSNFYFWSEEKEKQYADNLSKLPYNKVFCPIDKAEIFKVIPSIWSAIYKKTFLIKENILFNPTPGASYQDISFTFKVFLSAKTMICIPGAYLCYRCDNENSSVKSPKKVYCIMDEFQVVMEFIKIRKQEAIIPLIEAEKFTHYIGSYFRIDSIYQFAFLERMKKELQLDYDLGYMDKQYWPDEDWTLMQQIRTDADTYFESTNVDYLNKYVFSKYTLNKHMNELGGIYMLKEAKKVIIYGAGICGKKILDKILQIKEVFCFAVTEKNKDVPDNIRGIPVFEIKELQKFKQEAVVIVAIKKTNQLSVLKTLRELGFYNVIST